MECRCLKAGKGKKTDYSLEPPERSIALPASLDFNPLRPM